MKKNKCSLIVDLPYQSVKAHLFEYEKRLFLKTKKTKIKTYTMRSQLTKCEFLSIYQTRFSWEIGCLFIGKNLYKNNYGNKSK